MKKTLLTIAIVLGMTIGAMAQENGGMFQRGAMPDEMNYEYGNNRESGLILPSGHGQTGDTDAPLGSGIAVLLGLGGAYWAAQKRRKE
jgi:LPXTG-motif cell wall-anchored protein